MTTRISMCTAFNAEVDMHVSKSPDVYSVDTSTHSDREVNRQLKKLYGRAWQKVKAGHPHYAL